MVLTRRDASLARCFGIIGRITDRDGVGGFDLDLLENDIEDVRRRFQFFHVVGRSFQIHQVGNACDVEIQVDFILFRRGSNRNSKAGVASALQQVRDRREWTHKRQIFGLEAFAAPLFHFFAMVPLLVGGQEDGSELVPVFANLASNLFEGHIVTEL